MTKLYLLTQDENGGYDTYDSAVVYADDGYEASLIHPNESITGEWDTSDVNAWAEPSKVKVTEIGLAHPSLEGRGVICASFNAG